MMLSLSRSRTRLVLISLFTHVHLSYFAFSFSTDFEVHRNWLAVTHSLPLKRWYFDSTSPWTLDYPPMFAYFEWMLSHLALLFDPRMLVVENLGYSSARTVLFQRLTVILTDIVYCLGVKSCMDVLSDKALHRIVGAALLLCNIGLLMVDHIHFQYNGILFGILLLSIGKALQGRYLQSAFYFIYLLHMKHIFIYVAPVYVIYLFKFYCLRSQNPVLSLIKLGLVVVGVTAVSLGPFYNQLHQLVARLFPFKRGLTHSYWAPNFWALYNVADKVLAIVLNKRSQVGQGTGGLVKEYVHEVLPKVHPLATFIITGVAMLPCLIKLCTFKYDRNMPYKFIKSIVLCACTSFMFGWHVHEKAILMIIIPLSLLSILDHYEARMTFFLGTIGFYSLFPLLFKPELLFIKLGLFGCYTAASLYGFQKIHSKDLLPKHEVIFLFGLAGLFLYENVIHYLIKFNFIFPFLPLMLTSVYCSLGVLYFWLMYYYQFLSIDVVRRKSVQTTESTSSSSAQTINSKKEK